MMLSELCPNISFSDQQKSIDITGITLDSRQVKSGDLFIALKGHTEAGARYIPDALQRGARMALYESGQPLAFESSITSDERVISVDNLKSLLGDIAQRFYAVPADLNVVGVTGTNGKSTCCSLIAQLFELSGKKAGVIGTLGYGRHGQPLESTGVTTPDVFSVHRMLKSIAESGCQAIAIEASSHGLSQDRVAGVRFSSAVFTNLTQDHLDYHRSLDEYAAAKKRLFEFKGLQKAVINLDANYAQMMIEAAAHTDLVTYSLSNNDADFYALDIRYTNSGLDFQLCSKWGSAFVTTNLYGKFNVENVLAALGVYCQTKADFDNATSFIAQLQPLTGRMEFVREPSNISVVVDYAHTPDALAQASKSLLQHLEDDKSLWLVFGCGGDRDTDKRAKMGALAASHAHKVVVTSDNPRTEDPESIIEDICAGIREQSCLTRISDRESAIAFAIDKAEPGDIVLIAGKGHEDYQEINGQRNYFSDAVCAQQCIKSRTKASSATQAQKEKSNG